MLACAGAALLALVVMPAGAQDEPDPGLASIPVPTGGCDIEPGSLVISWEWTNHYEVTIEISDLSAVVRLYRPPGGPAELVETIDIAHLFPAQLDPDETVTIGPLVYPGEYMWTTGVSYTADSVIFDEPVVVVSPQAGPVGPCVATPAPPPPPVPVEPAFTG